MLESGRLKERMQEREISQSELARRVGVSQATIFKLASGKLYGSKHLHKIARELGTTPAYLTGETDDPDLDAPTAPTLSYDQLELVDCYERLSQAEKAALLQIARSMAGRTPAPAPARNQPKPVGFTPDK